MTRTPGEAAASCSATPSTRCPRARSSAQLAGPAAAGQARHRPDRAGHPPRPHGRAQKLREFQDAGHTVVLIIGDYTARVGDPSGRSRDAARSSTPEEIDAQRRDLPASRRSRCSTASAPRCAATASGSTCRWRTCSGWRARATVARLLERDDFAKRYGGGRADLGARAALPAAPGLRLGGGRAPTSSSAAPTRSSTCCSARDVQQAYGVPPQSILTMPILPGIDGVQRMSKSLGNYVGRHRAAGGDVRQADERPGRGDGRSTTSCCSTSRSTRRARRSRPSARSRAALVDALPRRRGGAGGGGALRPRARASTRLPDDVEEARARRADGRRGPPAGAARASTSASRAQRGAAAARPGRRQARRRAARRRRRWTCRPIELDGAVLQVGKRRFKRFRRLPAERPAGALRRRLCRGATLAPVALEREPERRPSPGRSRRSLKTEQCSVTEPGHAVRDPTAVRPLRGFESQSR